MDLQGLLSLSTAAHQQQEPQGRAAKKAKGLTRQLAESEAVLRRKAAEYAKELKEHERLSRRVHLLETVLPAFDQQLRLLDSSSTSSIQAPGSSRGASYTLPPPQLQQQVHLHQHHSPPACDSGAPSGGPQAPCQPPNAELIYALLGDDADNETLARFGLPTQPAVKSELMVHQLFNSASPSTSNSTTTTTHSDGPSGMTAGGSSAADSAGPGANTPDAFASPMARHLADAWGAVVQSLALRIMSLQMHPSRTGLVLMMKEDVALFQAENVPLIMADLAESWFSLTGINLITGQREEPPHEHWLSVARSLGLSDNQRKQFNAVLQFFNDRMAQVMAERRQLKARLLAQLAQDPSQQPESLSASFLSDFGPNKHVVHMGELSHKLAANMLKERQARQALDFFAGLGGVLSPLQMANVFVGAWPYIVDGAALFNAVCETGPDHQATEAGDCKG